MGMLEDSIFEKPEDLKDKKKWVVWSFSTAILLLWVMWVMGFI